MMVLLMFNDANANANAEECLGKTLAKMLDMLLRSGRNPIVSTKARDPAT
jgi:hypothetical protein